MQQPATTSTKLHSFIAWLAMLLISFVGSGATCMPRRGIPDFQPKPIFDAIPTVEQVSQTINKSRNIQSLQSNFVTVNPNKMRNLEASLTWQRQRFFKIGGGISAMLPKNFEVGSNNDAFWMVIRDGGTPQLFFARHDEFEMQSVRRVLPISPLWLVEALGVSELEPSQVIQQPTTRPDGMLEITTVTASTTGNNYYRSLIVDPKFGYTRQVYVRDASGRLIANANQSDHKYYPSIDLCLPNHVVVQLFPAIDPTTEIDIHVDGYVINNLDPSDLASYAFPNTNGFEVRNLVQFSQGSPQAVTPIQVAPPQNQPNVSYRGVQWDGGSVRR